MTFGGLIIGFVCNAFYLKGSLTKSIDSHEKRLDNVEKIIELKQDKTACKDIRDECHHSNENIFLMKGEKK